MLIVEQLLNPQQKQRSWRASLQFQLKVQLSSHQRCCMQVPKGGIYLASRTLPELSNCTLVQIRQQCACSKMCVCRLQNVTAASARHIPELKQEQLSCPFVQMSRAQQLQQQTKIFGQRQKNPDVFWHRSRSLQRLAWGPRACSCVRWSVLTCWM
jgi:hypothetical protein